MSRGVFQVPCRELRADPQPPTVVGATISVLTWCLVAGSLGCGHPWAACAHMGCGQIQALGAAQSVPSLPIAQVPRGMG